MRDCEGDGPPGRLSKMSKPEGDGPSGRLYVLISSHLPHRSASLYGRSIASFPWRWDNARFGIFDLGKCRRTITRVLALLLFLQSLEHFLGSQRDLIDAHSDRIVNRVADRGGDRQQRPLSYFFGAKGSVGIGILYQVG